MMQAHNKLLTAAEAAERLRLSYGSALALIHRGDLPAARVGRSYRVRPEAIDEALRRLERAEATAGATT